MSLRALFTELHSDFHLLYILEFHDKAVVTKHVSVILQENKYPTRAVVRPKLDSGLLHKESMT